MTGAAGAITVRERDGERHVVLEGEVDLDVVSRLSDEDRLGFVHAVDSAALTFLDSSGLRFLLGLTAVNPEVRLVDPPPVLVELLEMTGTAPLFRTEPAQRS